jgi:exodeoxyribonuclease VII large subunit
VPVRADLLAETASLLARQRRAISRVSQDRKLRLQSASRALPKPDDMLAIARQRLDSTTARLPASLRSNLQRHGIALARSAGRLSLNTMRNRLAENQRRVPDLAARTNRALRQLLSRRSDRFTAATKLLQAMSYKSILARGFAVVRDADGKPLRTAADVKPNAKVKAAATSSQGSLF